MGTVRIGIVCAHNHFAAQVNQKKTGKTGVWRDTTVCVPAQVAEIAEKTPPPADPGCDDYTIWPPAIWIDWPFTLRAAFEQSHIAAPVTSSTSSKVRCRLPLAR